MEQVYDSRVHFGQSEVDLALPNLPRPLATRIDRVSYHAEENVPLEVIAKLQAMLCGKEAWPLA